MTRKPVQTAVMAAVLTAGAPAHAYVGPGIAGSVGSVLLGIAGVIALIVAAVFVRPVLMLLRRLRRGPPQAAAKDGPEDAESAKDRE